MSCVRCCCISWCVQWQNKWLRESACWLQSGQGGRSSCCESVLWWLAGYILVYVDICLEDGCHCSNYKVLGVYVSIGEEGELEGSTLVSHELRESV